jgi:arsenite-transporting ATPase
VRGDGTQSSGRLVTPLMRLRDPRYTKVLLVTLAETTPVSEAAALQADLHRAQIEPFAWVINGSVAAAGSDDPCVRQRMAGELEQLARVSEQYAQRLAVVPWAAEEPVGVARLRALATAAL